MVALTSFAGKWPPISIQTRFMERSRLEQSRQLVLLAAIFTLGVIFPVTLMFFVFWKLIRRKPVMDLRMFKNPNFAAATVMIFVFGCRGIRNYRINSTARTGVHGVQRGAGRFNAPIILLMP